MISWNNLLRNSVVKGPMCLFQKNLCYFSCRKMPTAGSWMLLGNLAAALAGALWSWLTARRVLCEDSALSLSIRQSMQRRGWESRVLCAQPAPHTPANTPPSVPGTPSVFLRILLRGSPLCQIFFWTVDWCQLKIKLKSRETFHLWPNAALPNSLTAVLRLKLKTNGQTLLAH